jgi:hypothetical protein
MMFKILAILSLIALFTLILTTSPAPLTQALFIFLLFCFFLFFSLIFIKKLKINLLFSSYLSLIPTLQLLHQFNYLNLALVTAFFMSIYFLMK